MLVPAAPAVLLLVGGYLDDLLELDEVQPFAALTAALGALVIGRDFFVFPENFVGAHMVESLRWPGPLSSMPYVMVSYAAFFAGVIGAGARRALAARDACAVAAAHRPAHPRRWRGGRVAGDGAVHGAVAGAAVLEAPVVEGALRQDQAARSQRAHRPVPLQRAGRVVLLGRQDAGDARRRSRSCSSSWRAPSTSSSWPAPRSCRRSTSTPSSTTASYYVVDDTSARYIMLSNRLGPRRARPQSAAPLRVGQARRRRRIRCRSTSTTRCELIGWDAPAADQRAPGLQAQALLQGATRRCRAATRSSCTSTAPARASTATTCRSTASSRPTTGWSAATSPTSTPSSPATTTRRRAEQRRLSDLHGHVPRRRAAQGRRAARRTATTAPGSAASRSNDVR